MLATTADPQLTDLTDRARDLARDIGKNVGRILSALQIGDISRQRAEHVQAGLALLDRFDQSPSQVRLKAAGQMLLTAQLEAAVRDYTQQVAKLLPSIESLATDALALQALSFAVTELGDGGRDLKLRMDAAIAIVAEIQAADGAARYLAGRLANDKGPIAGGAAGQATSGRDPLDQKASDFLARVVYLEAAADDCVVILERLKEASEALMAESPATAKSAKDSPVSQPAAQRNLTAAAAKIKAIRGKAEDDIAVHAGKNTDILRLLDTPTSLAISAALEDELEPASFAGLQFTSADDDDGDEVAFKGALSALLSKIERLYTMGQERDIQRAFSKAVGLKVAEVADETEDGLF